MPHLQIKIQSKQESENGDVVFPEFNGEGYQTELKAVAILEKATVGGDLGVSFVTKDKDGTPIVMQLTGNLFRALVSAFHGAEQRFKQ